MNQQIEKLKSLLNYKLMASAGIENPLERLNTALNLINETINSLNNLIENEKFDSNGEEIIFFKKVKPEVLALKMEEVLRYNLQVNKPIGTNEIQLKYFEDEIKALQGLFRMNSFHYQYFKNEITSLDELYFLRSAGPLPVPLAEAAETQTEFLTPMSYLFAKFIAHEHVQYYILEQIVQLKTPDLYQQQTSHSQDNELKWTGDVINIVELAYGLWLTGQLNSGNASLNQIVRWLETQLGVNIGIVQRRFTEIGSRKRLSITKFLDQMVRAVLQKIENSNA